MKSILSRLFLSFFILFIVYSSLIFLFNYNSSKNHYIGNFRRDLHNLNISLSGQISEEILTNDTAELRKFINATGRTLLVRITVIDKYGKVLADSKSNPDTMENHLDRPEFRSALSDSEGFDTRFSKTLHKELIYVASPVYYEGRLVGFIRTSYFLDYIDSLFSRLIADWLKVFAIISLLILIIAYLMFRKVSIPIKKLSLAVKDFATGKFETRVEVQSKDEIGQLTENFNLMASKLDALFQEVNRQKEESRQLEKIKKDFIVNVSHELKTPLTAIKGFIETIEEEPDDPQNLHYIGIIHRNTDRLINIVQDLLLLSELEDEEKANKLLLSTVDIRFILEGIKFLFEPKLKEKNLYLDIEFEEDFPNLTIDSYRIEQVFINLISNSIKYTESGGINITLKIEDNFAKIIFADTGIGIPTEDQDRIFERFYISEKSRSRKYDGSGIGLSIVKHIIILHKGTIELDKSYKEGTRFILMLPLY